MKHTKARVTLSIADNYRLCKYLTENPPKEGEILDEVVGRCVTEFPTIEGLNRDHVHNRLRELELPLTARAPVESPAREIARLQERVVRLEDGLKALQELTTELQGKLARTESTLAAHRLAIQGAGKWTTAPGHIEPTIQPAKFSA